MAKILGISILLFWSSFLFGNDSGGIIIGRYANLRSQPTVIDSNLIARLYKGTAIHILDKTSQKVKIGDIEGYWYKIKAIETGQTGWIFEQYMARSGDIQVQQYIEAVLSSLYYYREELNEQLQDIKSNVPSKNALEKLKNYNSRFLNYIGYHLLAEKNRLAVAVLIMFMNPSYQKTNNQDANYSLTWEILEKLTPKVLITNDYKSFSYWWQKNYDSAEIFIVDYELANLFKKIQDNENRVYRNLSEAPP